MKKPKPKSPLLPTKGPENPVLHPPCQTCGGPHKTSLCPIGIEKHQGTTLDSYPLYYEELTVMSMPPVPLWESKDEA